MIDDIEREVGRPIRKFELVLLAALEALVEGDNEQARRWLRELGELADAGAESNGQTP